LATLVNMIKNGCKKRFCVIYPLDLSLKKYCKKSSLSFR